MALIDRKNKEDLLKQIGRTEEKVCDLNRSIAKIDNELNSIPRRTIHLKYRKDLIANKISNHEIYINQLNEDLIKL